MKKYKTKIKTFKELDEALKKGKLLCLNDVRAYEGEFTGKIIKLVDDYKNDFDKFKKGDRVMVYHLEDYIKFCKAMDLVIKSLNQL